jgi:hypothetical protein
VFNPLTGAKKGLIVLIPVEELSSVVVTMKPSLTMFVSDHQNNTIQWSDKSSEAGGSASGFGHRIYNATGPFAVLQFMTHFAGNVFAIDKYGSVISTMPSTTNPGTKLEMNTAIVGPVPADQYSPNILYLVESEGADVCDERAGLQWSIDSLPGGHQEPCPQADQKRWLMGPFPWQELVHLH